MLNRISVSDSNKNNIYDICLDDSFDGLEAELLGLKLSGKKICIVSETNVAPLYMSDIFEITKNIGHKVIEFVFEAGEERKTLDTVKALYTKLIEEHFDRNDCLIALGGGVVGDLTGYTAATYLRGISFIQIPTTLLSQVDSSIGGKTGVDFDSYKNMVGAFHQPKLVYINIKTLSTLPRRVYLSGMGEVIKHGIIRNASEYRWLKEHSEEVKALDEGALFHMIYESINVKRVVVEQDAFEKGERALLNFGHTLGHAIEKHMNFTLFHGECVSLGAILAADISYQKGFISKEDLDDIIETFDKYELLTDVSSLKLSDEDKASILRYTLNDKKMDAGSVKFVLIERIGCAFVSKDVSLEDMKKVLK